MIYKTLPVFVVYIVFYSCNSPADKKTKPIFPDNSAYTFIKSRDWDYIVDKKNIPPYILDSFCKIDHLDSFELANNGEHTRTIYENGQEYTRFYHNFLQFALVNDSLCLINYSQDGFVGRDVVVFFRYKRKFDYVRYFGSSLNDTSSVLTFLKNTNPIDNATESQLFKIK